MAKSLGVSDALHEKIKNLAYQNKTPIFYFVEDMLEAWLDKNNPEHSSESKLKEFLK